MIIYKSLAKQNALHAVYAEFKGLHLGLWVVIGRLTAKGKIISRLSAFQYLSGLRMLQEGTYHLYRFTKINIIFYQKIAKPFMDLFITPCREFIIHYLVCLG